MFDSVLNFKVFPVLFDRVRKSVSRDQFGLWRAAIGRNGRCTHMACTNPRPMKCSIEAQSLTVTI